MIHLNHLKDAHLGLPAAVLGGAPSLPEDLQRIPKDAILIAANHHALRLVDCHYLAFLDDPVLPPGNTDLLAAINAYHGIRITHHRQWTDVDMEGVQWWNACRYSGQFGAWLASWFGCDPILLAGMDLYQGERKYFYDFDIYDPRDASFSRSLSDHLDIWRPALTNIPHAGRIRAVSGPLIQLFGGW